MQNMQGTIEYAQDGAAAVASQGAAVPGSEQGAAVPVAVAAQDSVANTSSQSTAANSRREWPMAGMTNAQAIEYLRTHNSGVRPNLSRYGYRFVKRAFDIVASGCAIVLLFIPSLVLCAAICIKSPGASPIYSQTRVGRVRRDGSFRMFKMYKFRSMVPNADERLRELRDQNEADGPLFKIKDDPRVIPGVGQFIRKHSIDELPQLINVFLGSLALIGPRPGLAREVAQYDERAMQRLTVKPGCGGAWQAGNRSDATFDEMISLDLTYVKHCSIKYDLQLIFGTLRAMIVGGGAY